MKNGLGFLESLGGFVVWFWLVNLGSNTEYGNFFQEKFET